MNETLLLFHAPSRPELLKIPACLASVAYPAALHLTERLSATARISRRNEKFSPTTEVYDGEELSAPLFLFCFFRITDLIRHLLPSDAAVLVHFLISDPHTNKL